MATITTTEYLDDNPRTAGESFTINAGKLIIRTDTRVHANAPAGLTGTIGSLTTSATVGGGVLIDGTKVREIYFINGNPSSTIPAIGTIITQGGVSGYFLGVWDSNYQYVPSGDTMLSEGLIKFREVTGGSFSAGALTGIDCDANGADVTSWIEVCVDQGSDITINNLGDGFVVDGEWYYLNGVLTGGVANQYILLPKVASDMYLQGLEVETAEGSGVFERWNAIENSSSYWAAARIGTNAKNKFVATISSGYFVFGYNGYGYVPPANCRIRIPNVIGQQSTTANRVNNTPPSATTATNPEFITTAGGKIDITNFSNNWYNNFDGCYSLNIKDCVFNNTNAIKNTATKPVINGLTVTAWGTTATEMLSLSSQQNGCDVRNVTITRLSGATGAVFNFTYCKSETEKYLIRNIKICAGVYADRSVSTYSLQLNQCQNVDADGIFSISSHINISGTVNSIIKNVDHCDRVSRETDTTLAIPIVRISTSENIIIDGFTVGLNGTVPDSFPYEALVVSSGNLGGIKIRNAGTISSPIVTGRSGAIMGYLVRNDGNNDSGVTAQRLYVSQLRAYVYLTNNTSKNLLMENCASPEAGSTPARANNFIIRGTRATYSGSPFPSTYGTHAHDYFTDDTNGYVTFYSNPPSPETTQYVTLTGDAVFNSNLRCVLPTAGDTFTVEMPYFALGHTAFKNTAPSITTGLSAGQYTLEYQIDTGTGWNGTWKTLNTTNLTAETLDPAIGFKLKVKFTAVLGGATSYVDYMRIWTVSSLSAQTDNLYPLDLATITLKNVHIGCRIQLYDDTNNVELYNGVSTSTTFTYSVPYTADFDLRVRLMCCNGTDATLFEQFTETIGIDGLTRTVNQVTDDIYAANLIDGSTVTGIIIDDANLLIEVQDGTYSWQEIYAYETYWLSTEEGIRDEGRFIEAIDQANYKVYNFKIKNISSPTAPLVISGGYGYSSATGHAIDLIDTTGGTIFTAPDRVTPFSTGTIDVITGDIATITADLTVINSGVKKASILVPHSQDLV